jgi:hypothetical protein
MKKKNQNKVITTKKLNQNNRNYEKILQLFLIVRKEKFSLLQDHKKKNKNKEMLVNLTKTLYHYHLRSNSKRHKIKIITLFKDREILLI